MKSLSLLPPPFAPSPPPLLSLVPSSSPPPLLTPSPLLFSEEDDDEYSDDDDVSWKVRRASAKCLTVILGSRVEMLTNFYHTISPVLISRFKGDLEFLDSTVVILCPTQSEKKMSRQTSSQLIERC